MLLKDFCKVSLGGSESHCEGLGGQGNGGCVLVVSVHSSSEGEVISAVDGVFIGDLLAEVKDSEARLHVVCIDIEVLVEACVLLEAV